MSHPIQPDLREVCAGAGIDTEYWDIWGRHHVTTDDSMRAILRALGYETESPERLAESHRARQAKPWATMFAAVRVVEASPHHLWTELHWPESAALEGTVAVAVYLEGGSALRADCEVSHLETLREVAGLGKVLKLPLPGPLPAGYHDVEAVVKAEGRPERRGSQRLVAAPERAHLPERLRDGGNLAGLAVSLYGLRSARNWGAGDFTDLQTLSRWAAKRLGAAFIALNPLHAIANRQPYNTSPYLPLTSFFRNYLYLDVEAIEDFAQCAPAKRLVACPWFRNEIAALRSSEFVEYERVSRLKLGVLRLLYRRFVRETAEDSPRMKAFRKYRASEGELLGRFSTFCALDEVMHRRNGEVWIWQQWAAEYHDPESAAVAEFAKEHRRRIRFWEYVQWQVDLQVEAAQQAALEAGMPIGLYHDLALATDRCGADFWAYRDFFVQGCRVGSPPDDFAPEGQDWAFPPPNAAKHQEDGYRLFAETIRQNSRHGGALRIDHVMRFFRLFWIPEGIEAKDGTYVNEHWEDLLRILVLESSRGKFLVVGEDLGTVPDQLRSALERFGILSYKLFYFERGYDGLPKPPQDYPRQALVSSTTHDLPTLAGFWGGNDIEARRRAGVMGDDAQFERAWAARREDKRRLLEALIRSGFLPQDYPRDAAEWVEMTGEIHNAITGYLASTPSMLFLMNEEDLTKEQNQQNLPGTTWQYPNWRRKMDFTLEELETLPRAGDYALMFHRWLEKTGRL